MGRFIPFCICNRAHGYRQSVCVNGCVLLLNEAGEREIERGAVKC